MEDLEEITVDHTGFRAQAHVPSRIERNRFYSVALERDMPYTVYLPSGYDDSASVRYPTLYMLHGMGGHNTDWEGYGLLEAADNLIAAAEIEPFIRPPRRWCT